MSFSDPHSVMFTLIADDDEGETFCNEFTKAINERAQVVKDWGANDVGVLPNYDTPGLRETGNGGAIPWTNFSAWQRWISDYDEHFVATHYKAEEDGDWTAITNFDDWYYLPRWDDGVKNPDNSYRCNIWEYVTGTENNAPRATKIMPGHPDFVAWEYRYITKGDIIGEWIFEDLQKALKALAWVEASTNWDLDRAGNNKRSAVGGRGFGATFAQAQGECSTAWGTGTFNWPGYPTPPADGVPFGGRPSDSRLTATAPYCKTWGNANPGSVVPAYITAEAERLTNQMQATPHTTSNDFDFKCEVDYYISAQLWDTAKTDIWDDEDDDVIEPDDGAPPINQPDPGTVYPRLSLYDTNAVLAAVSDDHSDEFDVSYTTFPSGWGDDSTGTTEQWGWTTANKYAIIRYNAFTPAEGGFKYQ